MAVFVGWELRTAEPLLRLQIFRDRGFASRHARARADVDRVRPVLLLRQRLLAGVARQERLERRAVHPVLLPRVRGHGSDRRADPRPPRRAGPRSSAAPRSAPSASTCSPASSPTCRSARRWLYIALAGGGLGLMLGPASTDAVNRATEHQLQRGHRHHPDRPQLRRQPRARRARRDPDQPERHQHHERADEGRRARTLRRHGIATSIGFARVRQRTPARATPRRSSTTSSSRSRTRPRPSSTSWPA